MIVVSDTTPLHYLILIDEVSLLPRILGEIVIPVTVHRELQAEKTPRTVKEFMADPPSWLTIKALTGRVDNELLDIDPGEREAILLAEELDADGILVDDLAGREMAEKRGLTVIGTLGLLEIAAEVGLLDFVDALERLTNAGFYVSKDLEQFFLKRLGLV